MGGNRLSWSPIVRAGDTGHPLVGYFDVADATESARDSGKWRVDLGVPSTDGIHPETVLHDGPMKALINPAVMAARRIA